MQTILGATGVIGIELAKALPQYTEHIRLVSRKPKKVNAGDQLHTADLTDRAQTDLAVQDSTIVYLTVGLPYNTSIWQQQWPVVMQNVINACKKYQAKLVFFDNVYLYGRASGWMTEDTPIRPSSEKGKVRAQIAEMLMNEVEKGNVTALIARAADFYGPHTPYSFANTMIFENYAKGKAAQWLLNAQTRHSFTYTPDAGKATAILGNTDSAYNQIWHLPTDRNPLTGAAFMTEAANAFGIAPKYTVLKKWMIQMVGVFNPLVKESVEMLYQHETDYLFDSSKFDRSIHFSTTSYQLGIVETAKSFT